MAWYRYLPVQENNVIYYIIYDTCVHMDKIRYIHVQPGAIGRILVVDGSDTSNSVDNDFNIDGWEAEALQDPLVVGEWKSSIYLSPIDR